MDSYIGSCFSAIPAASTLLIYFPGIDVAIPNVAIPCLNPQTTIPRIINQKYYHCASNPGNLEGRVFFIKKAQDSVMPQILYYLSVE